MNGNRDFASNVGKNLQLLRKQYHLTQAQLAERLEVSVSHIANIEREETSISLSLVQKIIDLFGITPNDLLLEKTSESSGENSPQEKLRQILTKRLDSAAYLIYSDIIEMKKEVDEKSEAENFYSMKIRGRETFSAIADSERKSKYILIYLLTKGFKICYLWIATLGAIPKRSYWGGLENRCAFRVPGVRIPLAPNNKEAW